MSRRKVFFHKNSSIFPQHFDKTFTLEKYPKRYVLRAWDRCNVVPCPWNCSFFPSVFTRKKKKRIANRRSSTNLRFLFSSMNRYRTFACRSIQCETRERGQISIEYLQLIHRRSNLSKNIIIFVSPSLFHFSPFLLRFHGTRRLKIWNFSHFSIIIMISSFTKIIRGGKG